MAPALRLAWGRSSNQETMMPRDPLHEDSTGQRSSSARRVIPTFASMVSNVNTFQYWAICEAVQDF